MHLLTINFLPTAHLLDLERSIFFHSPVKMELDGGGKEVSPSFAAMNQRRTEALLSNTHRSRRTTPVAKATVATSGRVSSWDESDFESEVEVVGTIHTSDAPWFNVAELPVVRLKAMEFLEKAPENF